MGQDLTKKKLNAMEHGHYILESQITQNEQKRRTHKLSECLHGTFLKLVKFLLHIPSQVPIWLLGDNI